MREKHEPYDMFSFVWQLRNSAPAHLCLNWHNNAAAQWAFGDRIVLVTVTLVGFLQAPLEYEQYSLC